MANYEMKQDGAPIMILGEGSTSDPSNAYYDAAMEGVSSSVSYKKHGRRWLNLQ
ncbi:MAG: hypothetical protein ABFR19_05725 [Pseudomonadota bacterium]